MQAVPTSAAASRAGKLRPCPDCCRRGATARTSEIQYCFDSGSQTGEEMPSSLVTRNERRWWLSHNCSLLAELGYLVLFAPARQVASRLPWCSAAAAGQSMHQTRCGFDEPTSLW